MYLNKEPNPTTRNPTSTSSTKTLKLGATLPTPLSPSNSFQNRPGWNLAKSPFKAEKFRGQEHYDGNKFSRANIVAVVVFGQRREIERRPPQRLHVRIYLYLYIYIYTYMHSGWLMRARCTENPFPPEPYSCARGTGTRNASTSCCWPAISVRGAVYTKVCSTFRRNVWDNFMGNWW